MSSHAPLRKGAIAVLGIVAVGYTIWLCFPDHPIDFVVYRRGADVLLHGGSLYDDVSVGPRPLPFTYPPFAGALFIPLAMIPFRLGLAIWELINALALVAIAWMTATRLPRIAGTEPARSWATWEIAALVFSVAVAMEPITDNFAYAQTNLIVVFAVLFDSLRESKWSGYLTGIATGFKITPGLFIVFMLVTRRWTAAGRAAIGFGVTIAIGALFGPAQEWRFWTSSLFETDRVGETNTATNVAISGDLARLSTQPWSTAVWVTAALAILVTGLLIAKQWWPSERLIAAAVVGTVGLLVSPISWVHHWVWMVPMVAILVALTIRARREHLRSAVWITGVAALAAATPSLTHARRFLWRFTREGSASSWLALTSYAVAGLFALVAIGFALRWARISDEPAGAVTTQSL